MSDFERVKDALSLQTVILQETSLKMKKHHLEQCPFCDGHDCFSIKEPTYKCFQCEASGDVFTFLEEFHKIDKFEALKKAAAIAGITLSSRKQEIKLSTRERLFIEAANYYHRHYSENGGRLYLVESRGHDEKVLDRMRIGFTDGGLVEHLMKKSFTKPEILASGLGKEFKKSDDKLFVDFFNANLAIFPHYDKERVLHFTIKDPKKEKKYQLPEKNRMKDWKFYNQGALNKYNEIILVEGENDLLSLMGAGATNVIGLIGQPSEKQIKALSTYCTHKHLYLFMDNDDAGKKYIRKICRTLKSNVRIITYPEKFDDPDEYVRQLEGDRRKEIKRLQEAADDYISWEIGEISKLDEMDEQLKALKERKVFAAVADMVFAEKEVFIDKLLTLRFSKEAIEQQLDINHDLRQALAVYFEKVDKKNADPNMIASMIFKSMSETGRFYKDREDNVYLMHQHLVYQIGNNRPFSALMKKLTNLLPTKEPGRSVWEALASDAYNNGMRIDLASWIQSDNVNDVIYVNLNSPNNMIMKLTKSGIEEIPNGMNSEGILLKSSSKIMPVNYHPDVDMKEGMTLLKELILDNMTCEKEQRYLILCWFLSAFLLDFAPYMGLMKFSGASGSGKTTTAKLLSQLIYGSEQLGDPSAAAAFAVASQNPMLIIDNLESDDFTKSILKFLLLSATKGSKEKRKGGTESETTQEQPKALVLITAIEPFTKGELINRTYDIDFSFRFKSDDFIENEASRHLMKKRDIIMSTLLNFISKDILPNLNKRRDYITVLKKEHKNHAKNRTDEYMALLMLILEHLVKYIPYYDPDDFMSVVDNEIPEAVKEIRNAWIETQNSKAKDNETSSNNIIKLLENLVREYSTSMKNLTAEPHKDYPGEEVFALTLAQYHIEMIKTKPVTICAACKKQRPDSLLYIEEDQQICECKDAESGETYSRAFFEFTATSLEIVHAFDRSCRDNGIRNPFGSAAVFGARLRNDRHLLKAAQWELVTKDRDSDNMHFKKINGNRFYKFRKVMER